MPHSADSPRATEAFWSSSASLQSPDSSDPPLSDCSVELPALPRAEQREHDHVRLWYRKCVQTRLCVYVEHAYSEQGFTGRSLSAKLAGFKRQREGAELPHTLELVQARVSEAAYDQLQHDLAVVRRLLDSRLPRNDSLWIHNLGRFTDTALPSQERCVQRMQLLLYQCMPQQLQFQRAREFTQELATLASGGVYRDFLRQTCRRPQRVRPMVLARRGSTARFPRIERFGSGFGRGPAYACSWMGVQVVWSRQLHGRASLVDTWTTRQGAEHGLSFSFRTGCPGPKSRGIGLQIMRPIKDLLPCLIIQTATTFNPIQPRGLREATPHSLHQVCP